MVTEQVVLRDPEDCMTTTAFGDRVVHPEFVGTTCDECGSSGLVSETALYERDYERADIHVVCPECA